MSIIRRVPWTIKPPAGLARLKQGHPLNQGLVGWWLMNEGGGLKAYDLSGKGNHGTLTNGPTWVGGQRGSALKFNSTSPQAVALPSTLPRVTGAFTLSIRANIAVSTVYLLGDWSAPGRNYYLYTDTGTVVLYVGNGATSQETNCVTGVVVNVGEWATITAVVDGTLHKIYVNGVEKVSVTGSYSGGVTSNQRYIGADAVLTPGWGMTGSLDDVRIYNRALSAGEVQSLYSDPLAALEPPPIIIWAPSAGSGAQNLTPSLVTNTSSFYAATITAGSVGLIPGLFTNSNSFYSPTVAVGTVNLTPSLFTNSNSFYSHVVSLASGPQTLLPALFTNSNSFYSASVTTGSVDLTPLLFTNTNSFYSPTISLGGVSLLPSFFSNTNSFYAPTVSPGLVNLVASLFTNSNTFYGHTVAQPSLQNLTPNLYSNSQAFYTHTISAGTTLSSADLAAIADAVWAHPRALTVDKFLGLK